MPPSPAGERAIKGSLAQIVGADEKSRGCGLLVGVRHVVTCAHVVAEADPSVKQDQPELPVGEVRLRLPFCGGVITPAKVVVWHPVKSGSSSGSVDDIAVLELPGDLPVTAAPALLLESSNWSGQGYMACGFTADNRVGGDWADGTFKGEQATGQVQMLASDGTDLQVDHGFSGTGVWDTHLHGFAGIIVAKHNRGRGIKTIAYMIPSKVLKAAWNELPISAPMPPELRDYVRRVEEAVNRNDSPCPIPAVRFRQKIGIVDGDPLEVEQIWHQVRAEVERRAILWGPAGAGKSTAVGVIVRECLRPDASHVPVLIDFKRWKRELSTQLLKHDTETDPDRRLRWQLNDILRAAVPSLTLDQLEAIEKVRGVLLVADALNEVDRQEARVRILESLDEFRRRDLTRHLVVTSRTEHKELAEGWARLQLLPLNVDERRRQLDDTFRDRHPNGVYDSLTEGDKELLEQPFFLQLAIGSEHPHLGSRAGALTDFFTRQLKVAGADLDRVAEASYRAYVGERSTSFDAAKFKEVVGQDLYDRLMTDGVVQQVDDARLKFDHQLKHDYLAARWLAKTGATLWGLIGFDAVSFEADSPYSLIMTLEQLTEPKAADLFLERVYDWNWRLALSCLLQSSRTGRSHSNEMETALLALVTDKRFDPVQESRERVELELSKYRAREVEPYLAATNSADLIKIATTVASPESWFTRWQAIFARLPAQGPLLEDEVQLITHPHSVIGWAAANVIRRFPDLEEAGVRQLRAIYFAGAPTEIAGQPIRWRVTHALGVFPGEKNVALLFNALDKDSSDWVKYGAARALVEIAATAIDRSLGKNVVDGLLKRTESLAPKLLEEIGRVIFFRNAKSEWIQTAAPLLQKAVDQHQGRQSHKRWVQKFENFQTGNWEQHSPVSGTVIVEEGR